MSTTKPSATAAAAPNAAAIAAEFESATKTAISASEFNADLLTKLVVERKDIEEVLKARFFFDRSFAIYGGIAGLYDYGPNGCAVKANLLAFWRKFFILEDSMLEVDCTCVTPHTVLEASGHVEKFKDFMVRDLVTKENYRADHLLEEHMDKLLENPKLDSATRDEYLKIKSAADSYSQAELGAKLTDFKVKAPKTKNDISEPYPFNLMFATSIGPGGDVPGFLRPELAQGIFLNFPRLLEANCGKVPFAAAQIGQAFRNEIAPRAGLLRVREFTLAEIEHFIKPTEKDHLKFDLVKDTVVSLFPRDNQEGSRLIIRKTVGEAVAAKIIDNQTLGYYIARTYQFLTTSGIKPWGLRFRQHLRNEMAHYAGDCWDAEILTTHGWIECVGIADRACYDLTVHSKRARLEVYESYPEPKQETVVECKPIKGQIAKALRKDCQIVSKYLEEIPESEVLAIDEKLKANGLAKVTVDGREFDILPTMVEIKKIEKKVNGFYFTPNVIEPSFGIGRIIYCLFEHAFNIRDSRRILSLEPHLAPVKCSVLPLTSAAKLTAHIPRIVSLLTAAGLSSKVDTVQSIGRRYSRTDEIGIPFAITIDFEVEVDDTVTLRNRDSLGQIRVKIDECAQLVASVIDHKTTWAELEQKYPKYEGKVDDEADN